MKPTLLICSAALALASGLAAAKDTPKAQTTTQQYVSMCNKKSDVAAQNYCHGFGQGVYEAYLITRHPQRAKNFICIPEPGEPREIVLSKFIAWSANHPQYNNMSAADTILRYLGETYPCKKA